jgi:hypothetical protein
LSLFVGKGVFFDEVVEFILAAAVAGASVLSSLFIFV